MLLREGTRWATCTIAQSDGIGGKTTGYSNTTDSLVMCMSRHTHTMSEMLLMEDKYDTHRYTLRRGRSPERLEPSRK